MPAGQRHPQLQQWEARDSNVKHRPVGLGIMRFKLPALAGSHHRGGGGVRGPLHGGDRLLSGRPSSPGTRPRVYRGSLWDRGILPQDTLQLLREERGGYVDIDMAESMDWKTLRERVRRHGMRNSNCIAIAPTATIANIIGVSASIEPTFQNLFVKSNLSGEFTVANEYLVADLKKLGLWDEVMVADLKYFDGNLSRIDRAPSELRTLYATAFEIDPTWIVEAGARRQKWIDQSQSLNIYLGQASGKKLDETYELAWQRGLKTTYYLRTMGATHAEKSTVKAGQLNAVPTEGGQSAGAAAVERVPVDRSSSAKIDDPECESCQ
jgi:ribonucleoside-diphosphate reductase alpha chain